MLALLAMARAADPVAAPTVVVWTAEVVPDAEVIKKAERSTGPAQHVAWGEVAAETTPFSKEDEARLASALAVIPPLNEQARLNLAPGNARDLWVTGAGTMREQIDSLDILAKRTEGSGPIPMSPETSMVAPRASKSSGGSWPALK